MCTHNGSTTRRKRYFDCESIIIITGSFYLHFITIGMMQSFGIIYVEILDHFKTTNAGISWISSLCSGLMLSLGPLVGVLERKFGCRYLAVTGSILLAVGMASSMFVTEVYQLYFTYGVTAGIGFALLHLVAWTIVSVNISYRKSLALGFTSSGIGFGSITFPFIINYLLLYIGWKWTFLVLGGICILAVVPGALFKKGQNRGNSSEWSRDIKSTSKKILSIQGFILYTISGICVSLVYLIPVIMTPELAIKRGINKNNTPIIITASGISSLVGRIFVGLLCESKYINPAFLNGLLLVIGGGATALCAHFTSLALFIVYGATIGLVIGTFSLMQPIVYVELVGEDLFSMAFGYGTLLQGIVRFIGPPVVGWVADFSGDYVFSYYFAGVFFIVAGIFSCLVFVQKRCYERKYAYGTSKDSCEIDTSTNIAVRYKFSESDL